MASHADLGWLISVDDHVLEPPNVWVGNAERLYRFTPAEPPVLARV
jgi:hypothetical protein